MSAAIEREPQDLAASGRVPPNDLFAEQAVLGAILLHNPALYDLPPAFDASAFYRTPHQVLFRALNVVIRKHGGADTLTLAEYLRSTDELEAAGGVAYISGLTDVVPSTANLVHYADIVIERSRRRRLIHLANAVVQAAHDDTQALADTEIALDRGLIELSTGAKAETVSIFEVAADFRAELIAARTGTGSAQLCTGLSTLDEIVTMMPGELWLFAGRPAHGKSVLALQALMALAEGGDAGMFVGLEMRTLELFRRIIRAHAELRRESVINPPTDLDFTRAMAAAGKVEGLPVYFGKNPDIDVITREATRKHRQLKDKTGKGLKLLVIDYLQRCRRESKKSQNRDAEIGDIAQTAKDWAEKNEVTVIGVAALNRESGKRKDPRPVLEDLRESGRLEYEANGIVFLHRPALFAGTPEAKAPDTSPLKQKVELILAKNRDGEAFQIRAVQNNFPYMKFRFPIPAGDVEV